ncbi:uncharacterized protein LOC110431714 isoform X3 [Sorghum bicolor]|nr:uncharacterized protein LOC110431247 isoform X3 [Sorghum bicolor]XP_021306788.1 uncharacterized protein LOC110431714 isoform X3 [Sorghum bicolor]|eukprot:XP_021305793.1 uncharacterized protein LOC110431247 isoform X3 [Sorghum bicolor]
MSLFCSLNFPVCLGELPIHNQAIHEAQKPSEDITDSLEVAGVGAFNSVERLMPSLFKLEIQRYRLRVFPITTTVKIGFKGPPGLTTSVPVLCTTQKKLCESWQDLAVVTKFPSQRYFSRS